MGGSAEVSFLMVLHPNKVSGSFPFRLLDSPQVLGIAFLPLHTQLMGRMPHPLVGLRCGLWGSELSPHMSTASALPAESQSQHLGTS